MRSSSRRTRRRRSCALSGTSSSPRSTRSSRSSTDSSPGSRRSVGGRPARKGMNRYLLQGERIVLRVHEHWATLAEPTLSMIAALALAVALDASLAAGGEPVARAAWVLVLVLLGRLVWLTVEWYRSWFLATDKRLLLLYGVFTRRVAMMPLAKVTDMSYS